MSKRPYAPLTVAIWTADVDQEYDRTKPMTVPRYVVPFAVASQESPAARPRALSRQGPH